MALQTRNRFVKISITRDTAPISLVGAMPMSLLFVGADLPHKYFTSAKEAKEAVADVVGDEGFLDVDAINKTIDVMFNQKQHYEYLGLVGVTTEDEIQGLLDEEQPFADSYRVAGQGLSDDAQNTLANYVSGKPMFYYANFDNVADYEMFTELQSANDNVVAFVHNVDGENLAAGAAALASGNFFGDWWSEFKDVVGMSPTQLRADEVNKVLELNGNVYIREARRNMITGSKVVSGEYIDIVETEHYLVDQIIQKMFTILATTKKIPYTQKGIDLFEGGLRNILDLATNQGVLATDENDNPVYKVSTPLRTEINTEYIKNRILPDVKFVAIPTGAIGKVEINGTLTFDMEVAQ